jgi:hypothetical protein
MHPDPETRKAPGQGSPVLRNPPINSSSDHSQVTPSLQVTRLVSQFGFAFETATVIAGLAWGLAR